MNSSELTCTNLLVDYFLREFVYRDLYYYEGKQKKELCDGLIDFLGTYIIFQIKEKNGSISPDWLRKKVYKKAVSQIKDTIQMMNTGTGIVVMNYTGEQIRLTPGKRILPVILFSSEETEYEPVHVSSTNESLRINVFSMRDFKRVLDNISIPFDIVSYLEMRSECFGTVFPQTLLTEVDDELTAVSRIEDEEGLMNYFLALKSRNGDISSEAIEGYRFVIQNCRERLLKQDEYNFKMYKEVLKLLLNFDRPTVQQFMERWSLCVDHCFKNETTAQHYLINQRQNLGCLFFSQLSPVDKMEIIDSMLILFKHRFMIKTVVAVIFDSIDGTNYTVEWKMVSYDEEEDVQLDEIIKKEKLWENPKVL